MWHQAHSSLQEVYTIVLRLRSDFARCSSFVYDYNFFHVDQDYDQQTMAVDSAADTGQRLAVHACLLPLIESCDRRNKYANRTVVCKALVLM